MSRIVAIIFFVFLTAILQVSFFPVFLPSGSAPDLLLMAVIFFAASFGIGRTWGTVVFAGFLADLFLFLPVGTNIFSFLAIAIVINIFSKKFLIVRGSWKFPLIALFIIAGTLLSDIIISLVSKGFSYLGGEHAFIFFSGNFLAKTACNLTIFTLFYFPLKKIGAYLFNERGKNELN